MSKTFCVVPKNVQDKGEKPQKTQFFWRFHIYMYIIYIANNTAEIQHCVSVNIAYTNCVHVDIPQHQLSTMSRSGWDFWHAAQWIPFPMATFKLLLTNCCMRAKIQTPRPPSTPRTILQTFKTIYWELTRQELERTDEGRNQLSSPASQRVLYCNVPCFISTS